MGAARGQRRDEWRCGLAARRATDGTGCDARLRFLRHEETLPTSGRADFTERLMRSMRGVRGTKTIIIKQSRLHSARRRR